MVQACPLRFTILATISHPWVFILLRLWRALLLRLFSDISIGDKESVEAAEESVLSLSLKYSNKASDSIRTSTKVLGRLCLLLTILSISLMGIRTKVTTSSPIKFSSLYAYTL